MSKEGYEFIKMQNKLSVKKVVFFSDAQPRDPSMFHRCHLISRELAKTGITAKIYAGYLGQKLFGSLPVPNPIAYISVILQLMRCDILIFHRHGNLLSYMILLLFKFYGKKVIYDFDDDQSAHDSSRHKILHRLWYGFVTQIIKKCDVAIAGSQYLLHYARRLNKNVRFIPTPVDTNIFSPKKRTASDTRRVTIGWLGQGPSHVENLRLLREPLKKLSLRYDIRLKLVSALGSDAIHDIFDDITNLEVDWGLDYLIPLPQIPELIADFDISVMPLVDNDFSRGKCAMKILESMGFGLPVVASDVGENRFVIEDGVNGFLASNSEEWCNKLTMLIESDDLRMRFGEYGVHTVQEKGYTLEGCGSEFAKVCRALFE